MRKKFCSWKKLVLKTMYHGIFCTKPSLIIFVGKKVIWEKNKQQKRNLWMSMKILIVTRSTAVMFFSLSKTRFFSFYCNFFLAAH